VGDYKWTREQLALEDLVRAELDRIEYEDQRQNYIRRLHTGWCEHCGGKITVRCYCRRDD